MAFTPVMWDCSADWQGVMQQMWFRGTHSDIGGNLTGFEAARPLANIPLVWMLDKLAGCDLRLPDDCRSRFEVDVGAPSVGPYRGWAKLFLWRRRRLIGRDTSEQVHRSAQDHRHAARFTAVS